MDEEQVRGSVFVLAVSAGIENGSSSLDGFFRGEDFDTVFGSDGPAYSHQDLLPASIIRGKKVKHKR